MHHPNAESRFRAAAVKALKLDGPRQIMDAIDTAYRRTWTPAQLQVFERIEERRADLYSDNRPIPVVDHGANGNGKTRNVPLAKIAQNSKAPIWARFIHQVVANSEAKACLEMGSCVGLTACHIAAASPSVVTLEGAPAIAKIAEQTIGGLGFADRARVITGRFSETLDAALSERSLDFVFVDGHHDEHATVAYWRQIQPHLTSEGFVIFDDIHWTPGMTKAWEVIQAEAEWSIDLDALGVVVPKHSHR